MTNEEAIKVLKDLRIFDDDCEEDCEAIDLGISALEKQINGNWVKCRERLPEKSGEYECTVEWYGSSSKEILLMNGFDIEKRVIYVDYFDKIKSFMTSSSFSSFEVIAWKYKSEPYQESEAT